MNHSIIRHPTTNQIVEARGYDVPSKIILNNRYFPSNQTRWMFKDFDDKKYHYLVDKYFAVDGAINKHYKFFCENYSDCSLVKFKSTIVRMWLKGIILFMSNPVMFGKDVNVVLISLMNDAKVFLYRTMFRMDKYLHTDFTGVLRKQNGTLQPMRLIPYKLLKIHSSTVYDALYDDAKKILPKYKKNRENRVKKYPNE